jgi:glycosyltransferase involved in cell wall biosynthesis
VRTVCLIHRGGLPWIIPVVRWEAETLRDAGFKVSMSTLGARQGTEEEIPGIHMKRIRLVTQALPRRRVFVVPKYLEFVCRSIAFGLRNRSDIYVAHDIDTAVPGYILSRLTRSRLVYYSLELYAERPAVPLARVGRLLERWFLRRVDATIACEPNRARFMVERYRAPQLPLVVLNTPPYEPPSASTRLRGILEARGIKARKIALYQGMIREIRCAREYVEAGRFLDDGVALVMVGRTVGHPVEYWDAMIRSAGVSDKVIVLPSVPSDKLSEIRNSADIGLQLQHNVGANSYYCAPIKLFQYLMAGLPVVACDFPGMKEIALGEGVGFCVSPTDPHAIADAINRLCRDDALYNRMRQNALRVAKEKYNWQIESRKLLAFFDRLTLENRESPL